MAKERIFLGLYAGPACDGVDAALVAISGKALRMKCRQVAESHCTLPGSLADDMRDLLETTSLKGQIDLGAMARIDGQLSIAMADAAAGLLMGAKPQEIAGVGMAGPVLSSVVGQGKDSSGQSLRPAGTATLAQVELGNPAIVARALARPIVGDFVRTAGAHGIVKPAAWSYWLLLRHERLSRVVLRLGGMTELYFIPADAAEGDVLAFDAGPGTAVLDALARRLFHRDFDADGALAAKGRPCAPLVHELMAHPFFPARSKAPAMLSDWGTFGNACAQRLILMAHKHACRNNHDIQASATEMVAFAASSAVGLLTERPHQVILAGGGAKNIHLASRIRGLLSPSSTVAFENLQTFHVGAAASHAVAYAILAKTFLDVSSPYQYKSFLTFLKPL